MLIVRGTFGTLINVLVNLQRSKVQEFRRLVEILSVLDRW